jgi:two-component system, NarL family, sensor kinase
MSRATGLAPLSDNDLEVLHTICDALDASTEREGLVATTLAAGVAQERTRLAREIHDTLAQGLSAIALQLETAEALLDSDEHPDRVRATLRAALETTRRNLEEARRSVLDLRAAALEGRTLAEAIAELCASEASEPPGGPRVEFRLLGKARPLSPRAESALYRIAQEALSNALQHARASRVTVELDSGPERLTLSVTDDGVGFEVSRRREGRFGLVGMQERVRLLGGGLCVFSRPGVGTRIAALVPVA